jgi:cytochrome c553
MKTVVLLAGAVLAVGPQKAEAQLAPPSGQRPSTNAPDAAQVCAACHGLLGAGNAAGGIPRLAGLSQRYSAKQLRSYADGGRQHPAMQAIARSLSPRDVGVLTAYFERLDAPVAASATPTSPPASAERGRLLAVTGSRQLRVQACNNCHGPAGAGEPPAIPSLAGQGASYLMATLNAWRDGSRRNDEGGQMAGIARALTPQAIADVSAHYSSLSTPPLHARADAPTAGAERPAAAPIPAADPAQGRAILATGAHGCAGCHSIPGVRRANGVVGPPLGGLAKRGFIAGQLPNRRDVLVAFLLDPPALVPSTGMPGTGLTREEASHIAAYLYTLER